MTYRRSSALIGGLKCFFNTLTSTRAPGVDMKTGTQLPTGRGTAGPWAKAAAAETT